MSVMLRRFTILALGSALFAMGMVAAVQNTRRVVDHHAPLAMCSPVSAYKCVSSL